MTYRLLPRSAAILLLAAWAATPAPAAVAAGPDAFLQRPVVRLQRPNGLTILVVEDHSQPLAAVMMGYRVGSVREAPGVTGIAHFLEHMLFRATRELPGREIVARIERTGGHWHGYTSYEMTAYYETVGSSELETVLHLEAQRMKHALIPPEEVEAERTAVIAELRGYENDPSSVLFDAVQAVALIAHPYRYNIVGWVSDLEGITAEELRGFYERYYVPANAVLGIVGDVDPSPLEQLIRRHLDPLPAGPRAAAVRTAEPEQQGGRRVTVAGAGASRRLQISFPAPAADDHDLASVAAFVMLDAVLAGGNALIRPAAVFEPAAPSSRLALAGRRGDLAFQTAWLAGSDPFIYSIGADLEGEWGLADAERATFSTIARLQAAAPRPEELARCRSRILAATQMATASYAGLCEAMVAFELLGDLGRHDALLEALGKVTPEKVAEAAGRLRPDRATVGWYASSEALAKEPAVRLTEPGDRAGAPPTPGPALIRAPQRLAPFDAASPSTQPVRRVLPNGMRLAAWGDGFSRTVAARLRVEAGPAFDPPDRPGVADAVMSAMLAPFEDPDGAWPSRLEAAGGRVGPAGAADDPALASRRFLEFAVELPSEASGLLPDIVTELLTARPSQRHLSSAIDAARDALSARAEDIFYVAPALAMAPIWGGAPLPEASETRVDDVLARLRGRVRPDRVSLAVAGDLEPARALDAMVQRLAAWNPETTPAAEPPRPIAQTVPVEPVRRALAGKTQAMIALGLRAPAREEPDHAAFDLIRTVLHHGYSGRLGDDIINDRGWAYVISSRLWEEGADGAYLVRVGTDQARVPDVIAALKRHLGAIRDEGPTAAEVEVARGMLRGRLKHRFETPGAAAAWLVRGLDAQQESERLGSVTPADVAAARRWFDPTKASIAVVTPRPAP